MSDFEFLQNKQNGKWVISAPHRSHRTNASGETEPICPFCPARLASQPACQAERGGQGESVAGRPGLKSIEEELYRVGGNAEDENWDIRVITNKFPFAPHHEVIIHSTDHHKSFDELPFSQVELILQTYRQRFIAHKKEGQTYLLHNSGSAAGASLSHPHSQLVVIPHNVKLEITPLDPSIYSQWSVVSSQELRQDILETERFYIFCPRTSEWPDEVWIAPKQNGGGFGLIKDEEITDLGFILSRLIQIFDLRHGHEFPFNFYIPPLKNWYLRLIPRIKIIGGFELGTNIIVNTQDPAETFGFIKEHFWEPDHEKIKSKHQAEYRKRV